MCGVLPDGSTRLQVEHMHPTYVDPNLYPITFADVRAGTEPRAKIPWIRFIAGDPMNPATKRLAGRSYSSCGPATCCRTPCFRTATRCPRVIASVWSCVT